MIQGSSQAAYVWTASSDGRGQLKRESPRRLFEGDDFYTVTDESGNRNLELEEKLHEVEDDFIKVRDEVIAKKKPLQVEDRKSIALFASTLYARTEFQRQEQIQIWQDALNSIENLPLEALNHLKHAGIYDGLMSLRFQPMPFHLFQFVNIAFPYLLLANCAILETEDVPGFITSDNPCFWMDGLLSEQGFTPYLFGLGSPSLNILLPISPNQMISLKPRGPEGYLGIDENPEILLSLNRLTVSNADRIIIINRKIGKGEWFDHRGLAEGVDQEFARQVSEFIEQYRPALEALAKK